MAQPLMIVVPSERALWIPSRVSCPRYEYLYLAQWLWQYQWKRQFTGLRTPGEGLGRR